jgi:uncharacterized membrane protein
VASERAFIPHLLMALAIVIQLVLTGSGIVLWHVGAAIALLVVPGWLLSRHLGLLVQGAPQRLIVTLGGSLAILIVGGFALNASPLGMTSGSWMAWVAATTALLASDSVLRFITRGRTRRVTTLLAAPHRVALRLDRLATDLRPGQLLLLGLAAIVVVGAVGIARASAEEPASRGFTQLWVLRPSVGAEAAVPPDGMVRIGVENHEGSSATYRIMASGGGQSLATWQPVALRDGERWSTLTPLPASGSLHIELYIGGNGSVYRTVHIGPAPTQ